MAVGLLVYWCSLCNLLSVLAPQPNVVVCSCFIFCCCRFPRYSQIDISHQLCLRCSELSGGASFNCTKGGANQWMQGFFGQLALGSSPPLQLHHETEQLSQTLSHLHCCSNLVLDLNCNRWPFISNDTNYKEEGIKKNSYMILNKVPLMMSHKYNN